MVGSLGKYRNTYLCVIIRKNIKTYAVQFIGEKPSWSLDVGDYSVLGIHDKSLEIISEKNLPEIEINC